MLVEKTFEWITASNLSTVNIASKGNEEGVTTIDKGKCVRWGSTSIVVRRMKSLAFTTHIAPKNIEPRPRRPGLPSEQTLQQRITTQLYHEMKRKRPKPIRYLFKDPPKLLH